MCHRLDTVLYPGDIGVPALLPPPPAHPPPSPSLDPSQNLALAPTFHVNKEVHTFYFPMIEFLSSNRFQVNKESTPGGKFYVLIFGLAPCCYVNKEV